MLVTKGSTGTQITKGTSYESFMDMVNHPARLDRFFKKIPISRNETVVRINGDYYKFDDKSFTKLQLVKAAGCSKSDRVRQAKLAVSMRSNGMLVCKEDLGDRVTILHFREVNMYYQA